MNHYKNILSDYFNFININSIINLYPKVDKKNNLLNLLYKIYEENNFNIIDNNKLNNLNLST